MKLHARATVFAVLTLGLTLHAASSRADVFDWNNITYAPASSTAARTITTPTYTGRAAGATNSDGSTNTVSLQLTLGGNATFLPASTVQSPNSASNSQNTNYYTSGGLSDNTKKALQIVVDFTSSSDFVTVNLFFAKPVVGVSFSFFDVDSGTINGGTYQDQISSINGSGANGITYPTLSNIGTGATNTVDNTNHLTQAISQQSAAQNSNAGNVTAQFNSTTPITQLTFVYGDIATTTGANHSAVQLIGLSDFNFTTVPEPGTVAMLGLGVFGAAGTAFRRRRA